MAKTELKTELVERLYPPGRKAVSFAVQVDRKFFFLDAPFLDGSSIDSNRSSGIIYSHFHLDHCPHKPSPIGVETYFNPETLILLRHIGVDIKRFKNIRPLQLLRDNQIDGLGTVLPIRVSHSSVDALAFFIVLDSGTTIFYSGDIRNGYRTNNAVKIIQNLTNSEGVSLFIGDATGVGRERLSIDEHIQRLQAALSFAKRNNAATAIYVKAGDYGNIALWLERKVFEDCHVFMNPRLQTVLGENQLNWLPFFYQRYRYVPPSFSRLSDQMSDDNQRGKVVLLYDDRWGNVIQNQKHVLINASRQDIPYNSDRVIAVFPLGLSGHSGQAFYDLFRACNPDYVALSHPSNKGQPDIENAKLVMKRKGKIFPLPKKQRT